MMPIRKTQNWLPGIFNDFFGNEWMENINRSLPALNIWENDKAFTVEVAVPGLTKEDFIIKVNEDNELVISMEKKENREEKSEAGRCLRREFSYSHFQKRMILPDNVRPEGITAKAEHGVLRIEIPKKEADAEVRKERCIEIR